MAGGSASSEMPAFVQLVGHPLRWRILAELSVSDRRVRELTALTGEPQSLVSYHLRLLREGGVVGARQSSADGRDSYYSVDLACCADLLWAAGGALHPALRRGRSMGEMSRPTVRSRRPRRVLFLCTGNSARSQMAEALLEDQSLIPVEVFSAGSRPKPLHPNAVRVMRTRGLDISTCRSKSFDEFATRRFDHVVTLCDRVRAVCPEFPGAPPRAHWSMPDPSAGGTTNQQTYPAFEAAAEEIERRVEFFRELIAEP
jgi:ArsR family transcriptional regulator, arsenate/arsenite/antimonite-responsive transcriptional repressor / arsenate reductase (thioredoxin)